MHWMRATVIVANEVTTSPLDVQQLVPMVEEIKATTGRKPDIVVAGAGYPPMSGRLESSFS